eukprot:403375308
MVSKRQKINISDNKVKQLPDLQIRNLKVPQPAAIQVVKQVTDFQNIQVADKTEQQTTSKKVLAFNLGSFNLIQKNGKQQVINGLSEIQEEAEEDASPKKKTISIPFESQKVSMSLRNHFNTKIQGLMNRRAALGNANPTTTKKTSSFVQPQISQLSLPPITQSTAVDSDYQPTEMPAAGIVHNNSNLNKAGQYVTSYHQKNNANISGVLSPQQQLIEDQFNSPYVYSYQSKFVLDIKKNLTFEKRIEFARYDKCIIATDLVSKFLPAYQGNLNLVIERASSYQNLNQMSFRLPSGQLDEKSLIQFLQMKSKNYARILDLRELARGGEAVVYRVDHSGFDEVVAKCTLYKENDNNSDSSNVFLDIISESQQLKLLSNKFYIAQVKEEIIHYDSLTYRIKQYVVIVERAQNTLWDLLNVWNDKVKSETNLEFYSPEKLAYYFYQMLCILEFLHQRQFFFGDMKPQNLLVFRDQLVKIGDLGISIKADPRIDNSEKFYKLNGMTKSYCSHQIMSAFYNETRLSFDELIDADRFSTIQTMSFCLDRVAKIHEINFKGQQQQGKNIMNDLQVMTVSECITKWTKIFQNDHSICKTLVSQMHKEGKTRAVEHIYRLTQYRWAINAFLCEGGIFKLSKCLGQDPILFNTAQSKVRNENYQSATIANQLKQVNQSQQVIQQQPQLQCLNSLYIPDYQRNRLGLSDEIQEIDALKIYSNVKIYPYFTQVYKQELMQDHEWKQILIELIECLYDRSQTSLFHLENMKKANKKIIKNYFKAYYVRGNWKEDYKKYVNVENELYIQKYIQYEEEMKEAEILKQEWLKQQEELKEQNQNIELQKEDNQILKPSEFVEPDITKPEPPVKYQILRKHIQDFYLYTRISMLTQNGERFWNKLDRTIYEVQFIISDNPEESAVDFYIIKHIELLIRFIKTFLRYRFAYRDNYVYKTADNFVALFKFNLIKPKNDFDNEINSFIVKEFINLCLRSKMYIQFPEQMQIIDNSINEVMIKFKEYLGEKPKYSYTQQLEEENDDNEEETIIYTPHQQEQIRQYLNQGKCLKQAYYLVYQVIMNEGLIEKKFYEKALTQTKTLLAQWKNFLGDGHPFIVEINGQIGKCAIILSQKNKQNQEYKEKITYLQKYAKQNGHTAMKAIQLYKQYGYTDQVKETIVFMNRPLLNITEQNWRQMLEELYVQKLYYLTKYNVIEQVKQQLVNVDINDENQYTIFEILEVFLLFFDPEHTKNLKSLTYQTASTELKSIVYKLDAIDDYERIKQLKQHGILEQAEKIISFMASPIQLIPSEMWQHIVAFNCLGKQNKQEKQQICNHLSRVKLPQIDVKHFNFIAKYLGDEKTYKHEDLYRYQQHQSKMETIVNNCINKLQSEEN